MARCAGRGGIAFMLQSRRSAPRRSHDTFRAVRSIHRLHPCPAGLATTIPADGDRFQHTAPWAGPHDPPLLTSGSCGASLCDVDVADCLGMRGFGRGRDRDSALSWKSIRRSGDATIRSRVGSVVRLLFGADTSRQCPRYRTFFADGTRSHLADRLQATSPGRCVIPFCHPVRTSRGVIWPKDG